MDKSELQTLRNILTSTGYFLAAICPILSGTAILTGTKVSEATTCMPVVCALLMITGTALALVKERGLPAAFFILDGSLNIMLTQGARSEGYWPSTLFDIFLLVFFILILYSKDRHKYPIAYMTFMLGIAGIISLADGPSTISGCCLLICGISSIYFAMACASNKHAIPLSRLLRSESSSNFVMCVSSTAYLVFALPAAYYVVKNIFSFRATEYVSSTGVELVACFCLVIMGILVIIVARKYILSMIFICTGLIQCLGAGITSNPTNIAIGIIWFVIGISMLLRSRPDHLSASMFLAYGLGFLLTGLAISETLIISFPYLIAMIIAVYIAYTLISEKTEIMSAR